MIRRMTSKTLRLAAVLLLSIVLLLHLPRGAQQQPAPATPAPKWALAIHGGAGTMPKTISAADRDAYLASLSAALKLGSGILRRVGPASTRSRP
jgi:beta-aspartyl-peptidase (threonine type)